MNVPRSAGWWVAAGLLTLVACSSDDFGAVGGDLPLDVSQEGDSVLVSLDPPLPAIAAQSVEPALNQPFLERSLLYLGNRDEGDWRATPLFVFDFSQAELRGLGLEDFADAVDSLELSEEVIERIEFNVVQTRDDQAKGIRRDLELYELDGVDDLDEGLLDQDIGSLLVGTSVASGQDLTANTLELSLTESMVLEWLSEDRSVSFGLFDLTPSNPTVGEGVELDSNVVVLASRENTLETLFVEEGTDVPGLEDNDPRITIFLDRDFVAQELGLDPEDLGDDISIRTEASQDMTHFQRTVASPSDLTLSSHLPSRIWLDFDLLGSAVPGDATINEALLTLHLREETSLGGTTLGRQGDGFLTFEDGEPETAAFEVGLSRTDAATTDGLPFVLSSRSSVDPRQEAPTFVADVTDFVQRDINLLLQDADEEIGILVALTAETSVLNVFDFYGTDAPEALRPRLEIRFTPPADFWE